MQLYSGWLAHDDLHSDGMASKSVKDVGGSCEIQNFCHWPMVCHSFFLHLKTSTCFIRVNQSINQIRENYLLTSWSIFVISFDHLESKLSRAQFLIAP